MPEFPDLASHAPSELSKVSRYRRDVAAAILPDESKQEHAQKQMHSAPRFQRIDNIEDRSEIVATLLFFSWPPRIEGNHDASRLLRSLAGVGLPAFPSYLAHLAPSHWRIAHTCQSNSHQQHVVAVTAWPFGGTSSDPILVLRGVIVLRR
jgi:hypothetical protein